MPKELVVLCDGTSCSPVTNASNPTNVQIFNQILSEGSQSYESNIEEGWSITTLYDENQHVKRKVYYDCGIGAPTSIVPPNNLSWFEWINSFTTPLSNTISQLAALGITNNVMQAYFFLAKNYEPGDTIYLSGFSRGAYT